MRTIKIIFAVTVLLLLAGILWAAYLLHFIDENKDLLAEQFSAGLGREVRIERGVSAQWSLKPSITLDGLWIGNPAWAEGEYFVRADRAFARINVLALLHQSVDVTELTVQGAEVRLETAADGRRNWSFGDEEGGVEVNLDSIRAKDSTFSHHSPDGEVTKVDIQDVVLEDLGGERLALEARITYRDAPVSVSLSSRPEAVTEAGKRPFQGKLELPGTAIAVRGELKGLFELTKLELELHSDRLDLDKSLIALVTSTPIEGSLQRIDGQFKTMGNSQAALLGNLSGDLKIGSADIKLPAEKGGQAKDLALKAFGLSVKPKEPVHLKTELAYEKRPYQIEISGGLLGDLFEEKKSWKVLKLKVTGQAGKKPFQATGDVGPLSVLSSGGDLKVNLSVLQEDLKVRLDGTFASLAELKGSRFVIDASGPSLSGLTPLMGLAMPDTPPFKMTAQIEGDERRLRVKQLNVTSGESDISGQLSIPLVQGERIEGTLESRALHLETFLDDSDKPAGADRPFLERELSTDALQGLSGSVRLNVGLLHLEAMELDQLSVDAALDKSHLKLTMKAENERFIADVDLKPVGAEWQIVLNKKARMDLGELIDRKKYGEDESQAPVDLKLHLEGSGSSPEKLLQSATGQMLMVIGEGQLSEAIAQHLPLGNVLYTLVGAILNEEGLTKKEDRGKLECIVVQLDVADGIATSSKGLALRTDQINILGGGALKLQTGEIELQFKTARRKGLGINLMGVADRLVSVTGTLDEPTVSLNVGTAAVYGAAAWATAGLSVLADSIYTRMTGFSNPCEHVMKSIGK